MRQSSTFLKLVAVTVAVALVGVYVGYRVLRAEERRRAAAAPAAGAPSAGSTRPTGPDGKPLEIIHGSKSLVVTEPEPPPFEPMGGSKSGAVIRVDPPPAAPQGGGK